MVRSKQGSIRLQAQSKLAKDFPNLSLSEKMVIWSLFENEVKAEIFVGIGEDEEGGATKGRDRESIG